MSFLSDFLGPRFDSNPEGVNQYSEGGGAQENTHEGRMAKLRAQIAAVRAGQAQKRSEFEHGMKNIGQQKEALASERTEQEKKIATLESRIKEVNRSTAKANRAIRKRESEDE